MRIPVSDHHADTDDTNENSRYEKDQESSCACHQVPDQNADDRRRDVLHGRRVARGSLTPVLDDLHEYADIGPGNKKRRKVEDTNCTDTDYCTISQETQGHDRVRSASLSPRKSGQENQVHDHEK